jgi:hypothetical protein
VSKYAECGAHANRRPQPEWVKTPIKPSLISPVAPDEACASPGELPCLRRLAHGWEGFIATGRPIPEKVRAVIVLLTGDLSRAAKAR